MIEQKLSSAIGNEIVEGKKEILIAVQYAYLRQEITDDVAEELIAVLEV